MSGYEISGYLKKWTNYVYRWKMRYFFIKDSVLHYSDGPKDDPKGAIDLLLSSIKIYAEDPLRITVNAMANSMHLKCCSISEKVKWLNALRLTQLNKSSPKKHSVNIKPEEIPAEEEIFFEKSTVGQIIDLQASFEFFLNSLISKHEKNEEFQEDLMQVMDRFADISVKVTQAMNNSEREKDKYLKIIRQVNGEITEMSNRDISSRLEEEDFPFEIGSNNETPKSSPCLPIIDYSQAKRAIMELFKGKFEVGNEEKREKLPGESVVEKLNIVSIMKECIGKDTSKLSFPVKMNEPLSALQRQAELFRFRELLSKANNCEDSYLRLAYVAAFVVSSFSSSIGRFHKPFNPLLGETYELEKGEFRFISEQVSHHPPICATFAEDNNFCYSASTSFKTNFWGKSIEFKFGGTQKLKLKKTNEEFSYNRVTSSLENLLLGKMYIENSGELKITNESSNSHCLLNLKRRGWGGIGAYEISGDIRDSSDSPVIKIKGKWDSHLLAIDTRNSEEISLWQIPEEKPEPRYSLNSDACNLNLLNEKIMEKIPITDSRLRPDQRALEIGDVALAADIKVALEEAQRKRADDDDDVHDYKPMWFSQTERNEEEPDFTFSGNYWKAREAGFKNIPMINIFSL